MLTDLCVMLIGEANEARTRGEYHHARQKLTEAKAIVASSSVTEHDLLADSSRLEYEYGMLENVAGQYEQAKAHFKKSAALSRQNGDELRGLLGDLHEVLNHYFDQSVTGASALNTLLKKEEALNRIAGVRKADLAMLNRTKYNYYAHIMELAFDADDRNWIAWADKVETHDLTKSMTRGTSASFDHYASQIEARRDMHHGDFDHSAKVFSLYLNFEGVDTSDVSKLPNLTEIQQYALGSAARIARDYRDLARSLIQSTFPDHKRLAKKAIDVGLRLNAGFGNKIYQADMKHDLKRNT